MTKKIETQWRKVLDFIPGCTSRASLLTTTGISKISRLLRTWALVERTPFEKTTKKGCLEGSSCGSFEQAAGFIGVLRRVLRQGFLEATGSWKGFSRREALQGHRRQTHAFRRVRPPSCAP